MQGIPLCCFLLGNFVEILFYFFIAQLIVYEVTCQVFVIGCHVDEAMSGEVEEDGLFPRR